MNNSAKIAELMAKFKHLNEVLDEVRALTQVALMLENNKEFIRLEHINDFLTKICLRYGDELNALFAKDLGVDDGESDS